MSYSKIKQEFLSTLEEDIELTLQDRIFDETGQNILFKCNYNTETLLEVGKLIDDLLSVLRFDGEDDPDLVGSIYIGLVYDSYRTILDKASIDYYVSLDCWQDEDNPEVARYELFVELQGKIYEIIG